VKRKIVLALLITVCFLLQSTLFKALSLASISPNLMIVITSSFGFMRGKKEGMWVGLFSGLLIDILYGGIFGFYGMIYMYLGYINGFFHKIFFRDDVKLPMMLITGSTLSYGLIIYVVMFLLRNRLNFIYYLGNVIIPETIYTLVITIILYRIILKINRWLEADEKGSAGKFV